MFQKFVHWNQVACQKFDNLFVPKSWRTDGLLDFTHNVVPDLIRKNSRVCDVGAGKRPFIGTEIPKQSQYIIGIDIDKHELEQAPPNIYDKTMVADIGSSDTKTKGINATVVICEAVLEHVKNNTQAIKNISELTANQGTIALFIPSRYALFAIINRWLPESIKRKLLFSIFPGTEHAQGFPAYYNQCTPDKITRLLESNNVTVQKVIPYYQCTYFSFFLPAHVAWRFYQLISYGLLRSKASESFSIIGTKNYNEN
ncbi:methyltransferase domain-containing protein [Candidatus Saccharibacteria bacterium]|nr:methyltransferase domain-containing protein [Candidatus Saccharibacteria bacterium]